MILLNILCPKYVKILYNNRKKTFVICKTIRLFVEYKVIVIEATRAFTTFSIDIQREFSDND